MPSTSRNRVLHKPVAQKRKATTMAQQSRKPVTATSPQALRTGDEELRREVRDRLARLGDTVASRIRVTAAAGTVKLEGTVSNSYERKLINQAIRQLATVKSLDSRLRTTAEANEVPADDQASTAAVPVAIGSGVLLIALSGWWFWPQPTAAPTPRVAYAPAVVEEPQVTEEPSLLATITHAFSFDSSSDRSPVKVSLSFEGKPASGAFVTLHPRLADELNTARPYGYVGNDGQIQWAAERSGNRLPSGEYVVTAVWNRSVEVDGETERGLNVLPEEYRKFATSPLRLTVNEDGAKPESLEIVR